MFQWGISLPQPASPQPGEQEPSVGCQRVWTDRSRGRVVSAMSAVTHLHASRDAAGASPGLHLGHPLSGAATSASLGRCSSRPGWCGCGEAGTSQAAEEEAVGTVMQKHPSSTAPCPNAPCQVPCCSFPAALVGPRAQQPRHRVVVAGTDTCTCHSPFGPATQPNSSPQRSQCDGSGAGGTLRAQTSRARTAVELQNKLTLW